MLMSKAVQVVIIRATVVKVQILIKVTRALKARNKINHKLKCRIVALLILHRYNNSYKQEKKVRIAIPVKVRVKVEAKAKVRAEVGVEVIVKVQR